MQKRKLKKIYHNVNKKIKNNRFLISLNILITPVLKYFYFSNERKLIKGNNFSHSTHKSILFFTSQKCASTFLSDIFEQFCATEKMPSIRFSNYFKDVDRSEIFNSSKFLNTAFISTGYYYGAFRKFHKIPNLDEFRIVLVLRDPRDVLTSSYFSTAFNHPVTRRDTLEKREKALKQTIDEYVIENCKYYKDVYEEYSLRLIGKKNVLFLRYEDMIEDFSPWLEKLVNHCELDTNNDVFDKIISSTSFKVSENPQNFMRNVKAGDHLVKLQPDTIQFLNIEFKNVLQSLGYTS